MPSLLTELTPAVKLGDKLVHVGVLSWGGFKTVLGEVAKADLPLPKLALERIGGALAQIQSGYAAAAQETDPAKARHATQQTNAKLYEVLAVLLAENLDTLAAWLLAHPPIVSALVQGASNFSADEVDRLSAGELLRVARAAWAALTADGFFTEAAGFFGDLLGLHPTKGSAKSIEPPAAPAPARASPSGSTSA
jgi:hypothetical protein